MAFLLARPSPHKGVGEDHLSAINLLYFLAPLWSVTLLTEQHKKRAIAGPRYYLRATVRSHLKPHRFEALQKRPKASYCSLVFLNQWIIFGYPGSTSSASNPEANAGPLQSDRSRDRPVEMEITLCRESCSSRSGAWPRCSDYFCFAVQEEQTLRACETSTPTKMTAQHARQVEARPCKSTDQAAPDFC